MSQPRKGETGGVRGMEGMEKGSFNFNVIYMEGIHLLKSFKGSVSYLHVVGYNLVQIFFMIMCKDYVYNFNL